MANGIETQTIESLITTENWELARQAVNEAPQFEDYKLKIEEEFNIRSS